MKPGASMSFSIKWFYTSIITKKEGGRSGYELFEKMVINLCNSPVLS
jgi:hypothetical protein